ncbi:hypothetical protein [Thalassotalea profundi]|uniref:Choice-of-anchor A family protein n=1 Tax=Thalassotalea profundi TaxID=2036687 RepID=A0ABQ3J2M6_9GAMM|nr:hypothetical protein [Thalassotalea profundi]GHE97428.1 hypothetical protein GCM10011501_28750 [Thalassotalea profundi]
MKNCILLVIYVALLSLSTSHKSIAGVIDFGVAQQYTMATGGKTSSIILGSEAEIFGGVGAGWYLALASGAKVHGNACSDTFSIGAGAQIDGSQSSCGQLESDISNANLQASLFTTSAQHLGTIDKTTTLDASLENNYTIDSLLLSSGEYLTINGSSADQIVINIFGDAKVGSGAGILLSGGLTSANVIFNFINKSVGFSEFNFGGADISGTFLADKGAFILGDGATLNDVRFYTNHTISANVQVVRTELSPTIPDDNIVIQVPESQTYVLLVIGLFFLLFTANAKRA